MRITGGQHGSRRIKVPAGKVRPTQDRVREALFSSLAARVPGCRFLDLFAGSGSVGLEALSRGAESVCLVEKDARTASVIKENAEDIAPDAVSVRKVTVVRSDALQFLRRQADREQYDLIFADPPYPVAVQQGVLRKALKLIETGHILSPNGMAVTEQRSTDPADDHETWKLVQEKVYGEARLCCWQML